MLKALFKKQFFEINSWLIQDRKTGKRRSGTGIALYLVLYIVLFAFLGGMFFLMSLGMCVPLSEAGLDWLYFVMTGIVAIFFGVFGSVFNTYASLYCAKDNEFLLAMPIPPYAILAVRLFGVWIWSFIYEALVFIPSLIAYWVFCSPTVYAVIFGIVVMLVISVLVLTLSCILGWVVAKISAKLKNKSFITVIISLIFFGVYYIICFRATEIVESLIANADAIGEKLKSIYPIYVMGRACVGDALSALIFTLIVLVLFAVVYFVLSHSFIKITTYNKGETKKKYKEKQEKAKSSAGALLFKESRRFFSSATYMLNCALGTVLLPVVAILAVINKDRITAVLDVFSDMGVFSDLAVLIGCGVMCIIASMNDITAPSVSLEGKNLWILQSLPVSPWDVLKAKLKLHIIISEIPVLLCSAAMIFILRPGILLSVLLVVIPAMFVCLSAMFGLCLNLKSPNLKWTSESIPVKQSLPVAVSLFGGWAFVLILGGIYFLLGRFLAVQTYLIICAAIIILASACLFVWLKNKGSKIFANL